MNNNLKAFFTKAASFIGMLSIIPIQIFFANDSEVIGAASILFIVCAITMDYILLQGQKSLSAILH